MRERVARAARNVGDVCTLYKKMGDKVLPVDEGHAVGESPAGDVLWREKALAKERRLLEITGDARKYRGFLIPKFTSIVRGRRLTPTRIKQLNIGPNLRPAERDLVLQVLYNREAAIAFDSKREGSLP